MLSPATNPDRFDGRRIIVSAFSQISAKASVLTIVVESEYIRILEMGASKLAPTKVISDIWSFFLCRTGALCQPPGLFSFVRPAYTRLCSPSRDRTSTLLIQNQTCCQLHQRGMAPEVGIEPTSYPHSKYGCPYQQSNSGMFYYYITRPSLCL